VLRHHVREEEHTNCRLTWINYELATQRDFVHFHNHVVGSIRCGGRVLDDVLDSRVVHAASNGEIWEISGLTGSSSTDALAGNGAILA
jgi:hypothetical protein